MTVSFSVTAEESAIIHEIAKRAAANVYGGELLEATMDITATHANGCPLNLAGLLAAEPFDFAHDIAGIRQYIDRDTGRMGGNFLPRYHSRGEESK